MPRFRIDNNDIIQDDVWPFLLEHFPDMVHSVDDDGTIVYANRTAENLLGYSLDELIGMNVRDIYAPEILEALETGFRQLKDTGQKEIESLLRHKDGTIIPVEIRSFSIYDDDGNFVRTFSTTRDLRQLKELQENLLHSSRLAGIGEMAAGIAHDISNPLMALQMTNEVMADELQAVTSTENLQISDLTALSSDIAKASQAIGNLVTKLRNFARKGSDSATAVNLNDIVDNALFMTDYRRRRCNVTVEKNLTGDHIIIGQANCLEQVFMNLFANACDAMESRKNDRILTIQIQQDTLGKETYWRCDISDTGTGIPEEYMMTMFDAFFTTKPKNKGTGLGLSIVKGIINEHNGKIDVSSELGEGTTFSIWLPIHNSP